MNIKAVARIYVAVGILAILAGGTVSAFCAKQPSTLAMWASAYLVLVVGVVQVFFGVVLAKLGRDDARRLAYWAFGLFNVGNAAVIVSTALKYGGYEQYLAVTAGGSVLIIAALTLLGWQLRGATKSWLKLCAYAVLAVLAVSCCIGLVLAPLR